MRKRQIKTPLHYWDTCNFLTILKKEEENLEGCLDVLSEAQNGSLKIVTSSLTLAAIVKLEGGRPSAALESEESRIIELFFLHDYFIFRDLDRKTAEIARRLSWELQIRSFDAIHIATAIRAQVDYFETLDNELRRKTEESLRAASIEVRKPHIPTKQLAMLTNEANFSPVQDEL